MAKGMVVDCRRASYKESPWSVVLGQSSVGRAV